MRDLLWSKKCTKGRKQYEMELKSRERERERGRRREERRREESAPENSCSTSKPLLMLARLLIIACTVFACSRDGTPPHGPEVVGEKKREGEGCAIR